MAPKTRSKKPKEEKHALLHVEVKDLRNFVQSSFREIEAIEAEQRRQELMKEYSRTVKPSSNKHETSLSRSKGLYGSVQNIEPQTRTSFRKLTETPRNNKEKSQDPSQQEALLQREHNKEVEKQKLYDAETQQINERLNAYQKKQEAAILKQEVKNTSRMIVQLHTERPADVVNNRRLELEQDREERLKALYIKKTKAIENSKLMKEKAQDEKKKGIIVEQEKKKQNQAEHYKTAREREKEEMAAVQRRIDKKNENSKMTQGSRTFQQRETANEFNNEIDDNQAFKHKLQMENSQRINRINEYKRNKILEKHMLLSLKNDQRKSQTQNAQNDVLARNIQLQKDMDLVYDCLGKMKKADPRDPKQKTLLLDAMNRLNDHFHLNLDLVPKSEKIKAEEEEDDES